MTGLDINEVPEGLGDMIVPKIPGDLVTSVEFPPWCCHLKNCLTLLKQLKRMRMKSLRDRVDDPRSCQGSASNQEAPCSLR